MTISYFIRRYITSAVDTALLINQRINNPQTIQRP